MNKTVFAVTLLVTNIATFTISKMFLKNGNATSLTQESPYLNIVQSYYEAINTPPSENTNQIFNAILLPDWTVTPPLAGGVGVDGVVKTLGMQYNSVPNFKTSIQEVISSGNKVIVKSIVSGTPNGQFMGVNTNGSKSFEVPAIDIHTIKDGKIADSQHSIDWSIAISQVKDDLSQNNSMPPVVPSVPETQPQAEQQPQTPPQNN